MDGRLLKFDVIILGGGAAGLAAAASFGRKNPGARFAVIEKESKLGKKLLATGSGRCNLTNLSMSEDFYNYSSRHFVGSIISRITPERLIKTFEQLGLICKEDSAGRVYPYSNQAASVLDVLTLNVKKYGAEIFCDTRIESISAQNGGFILSSGDRSFFCEKLILAAGGEVQPALGSDGSSYRFANQLGLECSPLFPSLAPVVVADKALAAAKGVRTVAAVSAAADGKIIHTEYGELQLNDKNISGICVFQLSRYVNEYFALGTVFGRKCRSIEIFADLAPDMTEDELLAFLTRRSKDFPELPAEDILTGLLNKKLCVYLLKKCDVDRSRNVGSLNVGELSRLAQTVKKCRFVPSGASGRNTAQVTAGGVSLSEIDRNMRSVKYRNLYIVGEALDADGLCGGYNLHFAFAGGFIAGTHSAKSGGKHHDKN